MPRPRRNPHAPSPRGYRDWYQLEAWRRRAKLQLLLDPLCAYCLQRGLVVPAEIADHVERHGGDYTKFLIGKLQSLCRSCHSSIKAYEERRGFRLGVSEHGWPLDPRHPVNRPRDPS